MDQKNFLEHKPNRSGRGKKKISKEQREAVLQVWKDNPSFGPGQVLSQLRRQGRTISIRSIRKIMQEGGYQASRQKKIKRPAVPWSWPRWISWRSTSIRPGSI